MTGDFLFFSVFSVNFVVQALMLVALDSRLRGNDEGARGNDGDGGERDLDKLPVLGAIRFGCSGEEAVETEPD